MEVKLDKQYPLDVDAGRAWKLLSDLRATAACMPGAEITEQLSETSYKGGVKVKVGPATAQFGGTVDVLELSEVERKVVMRGKGADKGGSSATMDLTATIMADPANPAHCILNGNAAVIVNGKFAQFGGRMMVQVSDMILGQFVENFRQTALAMPAEAAADAASGAEGSGAAASEGVAGADVSASSDVSAAGAGSAASGSTTGGSAAGSAAGGASAAGVSGAATPRPPVVAKEINGLAIFWGLIKSWFGGLFGRR